MNDAPILEISKIAIIARDYRESDGNSDFSNSLDEILNYCDDNGCDSILFSLFTILEENRLDFNNFKELKSLKSLFIEEFKIEKNTKNGNDEKIVTRYIVYYKHKQNWHEYELTQKFGTLSYTKKFEKVIIDPFIAEIKESRILGNCSLLLCGESNVVKYSKKDKVVFDKYNYSQQIPISTNIILNPIHDKMTRFEMKLKRKYLSQNNRIVISVWNKGKVFKNGVIRDGINPPWTVFINGKEIEVKREIIEINNIGAQIDIGIVDLDNIYHSQIQ